MTRCKGKKDNGLLCKNEAQEGSDFCKAHSHKRKKLDLVETDDMNPAAMEKIDQLVAKITVIEALLSKMALSSNVDVKTKKERNMTTAGILRKAKFAFYKEYKNNPALRASLVEKLGSVGLLTTKVVNGSTVPDVSWIEIKKITDKEFDKLEDDDKQKWCEKAIAPAA